MSLLAVLAALACTNAGNRSTDDTATAAGLDTIAPGAREVAHALGPPPAPRDSPRVAPSAVAASATSEDTLVGQVSEMGADPATWIALVPRGGRAVRLGGNVAPLRSLTGAEIWVSGGGEHDGFQVTRFEVRKVNGRDVDDGIVMLVQPDRLALRMRSGATRSIPNAPPALRALADARIWITRPVANQAPSYGVIEEPAR
ncbi:MAG: hypothetical protein ACREUZ_13980 [Burkholderiales bacterium]